VAVREPDLRPFRADLLILDVPLVVGLEVVGLRTTVLTHLGKRARTGPRAGGELLDWRAGGAAGADLEAPDLPSPVGLEPGISDAELREIADTTAALGRAWAGPLVSEVRARSLATAYAAAARGGLPIASNAFEVWRISRGRAGLVGTTGLVAGSAELMLYLVSCGAIKPDEAWDAYGSLAGTIAGFTPGWLLDPAPQGDRTRDTFLGWAREAQDGRL
jgi:hypothetical protein